MYCLVCGDIAQGINFNALTCMSCKTFFRRNVLRVKELRCHFSNQCAMTRVTRKFCTKCRLNKCFAVGMRKESVQTDKQKSYKMRFFNSQLRKQEADLELMTNNSFAYSINSSNNSQLPEPICDYNNELAIEVSNHSEVDDEGENQDDFINQTFKLMTTEEIQQLQTFKTDLLDYLRQNENPISLIELIDDCTPESFHHLPNQLSFQSDNRYPIKSLKSDKSIDYLSECLQSVDNDLTEEFGDPVLDLILKTKLDSVVYPKLYHQLSPQLTEILPEEIFALRELINACKVLRNPYHQICHLSSYFDCDGTVPEEHKMSKYTFFRLLKMCFQLGAFAEMPQQQQYTVLEENIFDMMAIQMVLMYNQDRKCWSLIDDKNKVTVLVPLGHLLKKRGFSAEVYDEHTKRHYTLMNKLRSEWRQDDLIFDLLTAISLFMPSEESVSSNYQVRNKYLEYVRLLRRYLGLKYPQEEEANETFNTLMQCSEEIRQYTHGVRHLFVDKFRLVMQHIPLIVASHHILFDLTP